MSSEDDINWGERLRNIIEPALEDERKAETQRLILEDCFNKVAKVLRPVLKNTIKQIEGKLERVKPEDANVFVISELTLLDDKGNPRLNPLMRIPLPLSVAFTEFAAADVREMESFQKLHMEARDLDVAIRLYGVINEEGKSPSPYPTQPMVIIDASKTYEQGAIENANLYPTLPPKPARFNRGGHGDFSL